MTIFTSTVADALKETLDEIVDDPHDGFEKNALIGDWAMVKTQSDYWEDDLEMAGPGLASARAEGSEISLGSIKEGYKKRYIPRNFGLRLVITQEAMEDNKYPEAIKLGKRLKRAIWKTVDVDSTNMLVRATNASYVGGDGVALASASHTLPHGGTFSNLMSTAMSPSRAAVIIATTDIRTFAGHDGTVEGAQPKCVVCPMDQWAVWEGLTKSTRAPEAGQFNEINVVNRLNLDVVPNKYWNNTTTNWGIVTDADNGLQFRWRVRPESRTWVDNDNLVMKYAIRARWAHGWSDARGFYFSAA